MVSEPPPIDSTPIADLTALLGLPLTDLDISNTKATHLAGLSGMPLERLALNRTQVKDLSPLRSMRLTALQLDRVPVSDLKPILKMPLTFLVLSGTEVRDVTVLKDLPLERVVLPKRTGVGEVAPNTGVTFQPGVGYGLFTMGARSYGVQICSDATPQSAVHLPAPVDVQIVTGQGIGHAAVHHQFLAFQIVADFNGSGVWRPTAQGQAASVPHYWRETTSTGGQITYYEV